MQSDGILKPLPPIPKGFEWVTEPVKQDELARNLKVISDVLERNRGHISADHSRTQLTKVMIRNIAYFNRKWYQFPESLMKFEVPVYKQVYNQVRERFERWLRNEEEKDEETPTPGENDLRNEESYAGNDHSDESVMPGADGMEIEPTSLSSDVPKRIKRVTINPKPISPETVPIKSEGTTQTIPAFKTSLRSDNKVTDAAHELDILRSQKASMVKQMRKLDKLIEEQVALIMQIVSAEPDVEETE